MSRRLPSARIHHENMETNQAIKGDLRNKFVFVFFISFGFMFSLFYFHSTPLTNISIYVSAPDTKLVKETVIDHVVPYSKPVMETVIEHVVPDTKPVTEHVVRDTKSFTETTVTEHVVPDTKPVTETDIEHAVSNKKPVTEHVVPDTKPVTETTVIEHVVLDTKPVTETEHVVSNTKPVMETTAEHVSDPCAGRYIYVHELPSRFNDDMLKRCRTLSLWTDMCRFTSNSGLGPQLDNSQGVFSDTGWYATNQFAVDVIFDNRMKQYRCLTPNSSSASAIFVPFYAGFDVSRYLWGYNTSMRDSASLDLVKWLTTRPEWKVMGGRDHFLVGGRITWDFRRVTDNDSDWGNKLLFLPETKNMSMLVVESSPWSNNDYGIPYPTYFHPSKDIEVFQWQERMRRLKRPWLFSFAGAPRPGMTQSIRGSLIDQCRASRKCRLLECDLGESKCHSPSSIMKMFQSSIFCLQPQGDSYTRRSAFDSMLTGCIPVFFHPGSAYVQYTWHLPKNYTLYSVFIPEDDVRDGNVSIEKRLLEINVEDVRAMREQVIRLIPRLIYADPKSRLEKVEDAFDVAVKAVIDKVNRLRNGVDDVGFEESDNWKYNLLGRVGEHEWDKFFSQPKQANS